MTDTTKTLKAPKGTELTNKLALTDKEYTPRENTNQDNVAKWAALMSTAHHPRPTR